MGELRELTDMQQAFVLAITSDPRCIGKPEEAAIAAGFSEKTARVQAQQLLTKPHVAAAITKANQEQISGPLASKAVALLGRLIDDEQAPKSVRLEAAKTILDRAGHVSARTPVALADMSPKDIKDMSPDQLAGVLSQASAARAELERKLRDITPSTTAPQIEGRAIAVDDESSDA